MLDENNTWIWHNVVRFFNYKLFTFSGYVKQCKVFAFENLPKISQIQKPLRLVMLFVGYDPISDKHLELFNGSRRMMSPLKKADESSQL